MLNFPSLTRWIASSSANARSNQEMVGAERGSLCSTLQPKKLLSRLASISLSLVINISKGGSPVCISLKVKTKLFFSRILDYLLGLHRGLSSATFPDEFARDRTARSASGDSKEKKCVFFWQDSKIFLQDPPGGDFCILADNTFERCCRPQTRGG